MKQGVSRLEINGIIVMCPYCLMEQKIDIRSVDSNLGYCDLAKKGCNKTFYLKTTAQYKWTTLKIEKEP